jgi:hypothetical protein
VLLVLCGRLSWLSVCLCVAKREKDKYSRSCGKVLWGFYGRKGKVFNSNAVCAVEILFKRQWNDVLRRSADKSF